MKIICIGRNYAEHAQELKHPLPTQPLFFLKPETALIPNDLPFFIPKFASSIHYEVEIVIKICKLGKHIQKKFAQTYYNEIGVGIDFTDRNKQEECMSKGLPWEISKAFDFSAPVGKFLGKSKFENINQLLFSLDINGKTVQYGNTADMIFNFDDIIAYVSQYFTLKIGDLIFTGTPSGVGQVNVNDVLVAKIEGEELLKLKIK
jgi:2-keto-4-pentenoate hydratase/2-oxohepta-3-ene-1,7-dioic acid hydratase in catechol pathway